MIKLRLKKYGRKGQPCYRIVAMDSRTKRDGRAIEELGFYNQKFDLEKTFPTGSDLYGVAFQYHMFGDAIGSAVLETSADGTSWTSIWSKSGNLGDQWLQATMYSDPGQTMLRFTYVPQVD